MGRTPMATAPAKCSASTCFLSLLFLSLVSSPQLLLCSPLNTPQPSWIRENAALNALAPRPSIFLLLTTLVHGSVGRHASVIPSTLSSTSSRRTSPSLLGLTRHVPTLVTPTTLRLSLTVVVASTAPSTFTAATRDLETAHTLKSEKKYRMSSNFEGEAFLC